jgi:hypothetical protein
MELADLNVNPGWGNHHQKKCTQNEAAAVLLLSAGGALFGCRNKWLNTFD